MDVANEPAILKNDLVGGTRRSEFDTSEANMCIFKLSHT
jgi:hypothetical protein